MGVVPTASERKQPIENQKPYFLQLYMSTFSCLPRIALFNSTVQLNILIVLIYNNLSRIIIKKLLKNMLHFVNALTTYPFYMFLPY